MDDVRARVRMVDGVLVLEDPDAEGMIAAVEAHNHGLSAAACRRLLADSQDRVRHFSSRAEARGLSLADVVIVLSVVDDPAGGRLAEALMPGHPWDEIRARGEVPVARGLAGREGVQEFLDSLFPGAGAALRAEPGLAVVVIDGGVAVVESAAGPFR